MIIAYDIRQISHGGRLFAVTRRSARREDCLELPQLLTQHGVTHDE